MFSLALLPLVAFGLLALAPMLAPLQDDTDDTGVQEDDDVTTDEETPDQDTPDDETPTEDTPDEEPPVAEPATTSITFSTPEGATNTVSFTVDDDIRTAEGTDGVDEVTAPVTPTTDVTINTLDGDDTVRFGYSTSVDPGAGADTLELTISEDALAGGTLEAGTIEFNDPLDALAIEIEDAAVGFVHEVIVETTENPDAATTVVSQTMYFVLSASETVTEVAIAEDGSLTFAEEGEVLVQIELGGATTVQGTNADGDPIQTLTSDLNGDPSIALNRDIVTSQVVQNPPVVAV